MKLLTGKNIFLAFTLLIIAICIIFITFESGYAHDLLMCVRIFVYFFFVLILLFIVGDAIKFVIMALERAWWPNQQGKVYTDNDATVHSRGDFLKMRLNGLRSQLLITEDHRYESLNLKYQTIAKDLFLYGRYFIFLTCLVLVTRDELLYHDYHAKSRLFLKNQSLALGLEYVRELDQLYTFINSSLIRAFNPNSSHFGQVEWIFGDHSSKLGVVQLRQLRRKTNYHIGWQEQQFSELDYMPNWELPYSRVPYTDKYWRIYEPWLPSMVINQILSFIADSDHKGYFQNYPDQTGYVTLLARSTKNSQIVLNYLRENNWLTRNTSAVFMDFTLYNVDSRIFTILTLLVEQTPVGSIMPKVFVSSLKMQIVDQLGIYGTIILALYILVLIQFVKTFVIIMWFDPTKLRSMWYKLDLIIIILNFIVIFLLTFREVGVSKLLKKVEGASKLEFLNFRQPEGLHSISIIVIGFLVCITTLRLWRVLQFSTVFQLFSATLYTAWKALAATAVIIIIFLMAFGMAVVIINGNNSDHFRHVTRSFVSAMCFSFGFSSQISPDDLFFGGQILGLIFYVILVFVLAHLLINIFISIVNDYFEKSAALRHSRVVRHIDFSQFLRVEYARFFQFFQKLPCLNRAYKRKNRTVAENVKAALDAKDRWSKKEGYKALATDHRSAEISKLIDERTKQAKYKRRIERMFTVAAILQAQMELLDYYLNSDQDENSVEETDDVITNYSGDDDDDYSDEYNEFVTHRNQ